MRANGKSLNDNVNKKPSKTGFFAALTGTVIVALCCATPLLIIILGAVGLSAFTPYLDYVLFPALFILIIITVLSYNRYKKSQSFKT